MRYWLIADTHWGHSMIQKHCRRPADVDSRICTNWNRLIKPEDMVIHLGDVAFSFVNLKKFLDGLNGVKILVCGNHDSKSKSWYMRNGFAFACDGFVMSGCYFTHRPRPILPERATLNIHGHLHNTVPRGYRKYPHSRLFSLEYENYSPRILSSFLHSIEKEKPVYPAGTIVDCDLTEVGIKPSLWERIKQYFL
jgi:calcineurin-like phosphoesterase family protein